MTVASAAPAPSWRLAELATQLMPGLIFDPEVAANPEHADADIGFWLDVVRSHLPDSELLVQRDATVFEQLLAHSPLLAFSAQASRPRPRRVSVPLADAPLRC
ncbi:hypothetical protein QPX34_12180 [Corynebacterium accolens]|uniref:Uncharacterized protein n=1 Tax=Corynebacterium accolens TaxID=38284 RepID=A0ABT7FT12_9CORY|nr:hypothetical protein [Corynebacterium accolens]MDK4248748.1 hypothetical protein [Corynebacterium accolens]MDK4324902.1 hypothetical protein [Corynebacterium accolens]